MKKTALATIFLFLCGCAAPVAQERTASIILNDVHSRLNPTRVAEVHYPKSTKDIVAIVKDAKRRQKPVSISGGRHAMGGQQFGEDTVHISMKEMNDVLSFNKETGIVRVEAGIGWPKLLDYLAKEQEGQWPQWAIAQKQTGADELSLGGALSANAHGRGVRYRPIIQDVERFTLVDSDGKVLQVSRTENAELFSLAIGGYGLFGVIATVDLRLQPRQKLQRDVEVISIEDLPEKTKQKLAEGYLYGDFQYKTDAAASDFMQKGVFTGYKPVPPETPIPEGQKVLTTDEWYKLIHLAHVDKSRAFEVYSQHYLKTNGQIYWSDTMQLGFYADQYVEYLEKAMPDYPQGSLMITEVYVPRPKLTEFIYKVIDDARAHNVNIIYGTMRLIEKDDESFLAWAKQNYACVIFNLRVDAGEEGSKKAQEDFQRLIDRALEFDGSYFLTYHRWARKDQVLKAYPQFPEFLRLKLKYDPEERFQSEWYRYYKKFIGTGPADPFFQKHVEPWLDDPETESIFLGAALEDPQPHLEGPWPHYVVGFRVEKQFKGAPEAEIELLLDAPLDENFVEINEGGTYLIRKEQGNFLNVIPAPKDQSPSEI